MDKNLLTELKTDTRNSLPCLNEPSVEKFIKDEKRLDDEMRFSAAAETDCTKCGFYEATRYDETLGRVCYKCLDYFSGGCVYIPLKCQTDYSDLFEI